jgi:hypothetical protein
MGRASFCRIFTLYFQYSSLEWVKAPFFRIYIVIAVSNLASTVYYLAIDSFSVLSGFGTRLRVQFRAVVRFDNYKTTVILSGAAFQA